MRDCYPRACSVVMCRMEEGLTAHNHRPLGNNRLRFLTYRSGGTRLLWPPLTFKWRILFPIVVFSIDARRESLSGPGNRKKTDIRKLSFLHSISPLHFSTPCLLISWDHKRLRLNWMKRSGEVGKWRKWRKDLRDRGSNSFSLHEVWRLHLD